MFLWSRGEELITERFPEIAAAARATARRHGARRRGPRVRATTRRGRLPICSSASAASGGCARLRRTCRSCSSPTTCSRPAATTFARMPLRDRRGPPAWTVDRRRGSAASSRRRSAATRGTALARRRDESRARHVEGLMLKRWASPYRPGRQRGDWWKWKIDPFTVDAVLIYAQPGAAGARACSPTTRSACGTATSWCRWRRRIRASPTRRSTSWIAGCGGTRRSGSAR